MDAGEEGGVTRSEVSAGGLVARRRGTVLEVLVARQHDRNLGEPAERLPKGKLDPGETLEQAAVREVEEEVGVRARIVGDLGEVAYVYSERKDGARVAKRVHFFLMAWERGEARPADGEMSEVGWVSLEEAALRLRFASEREVVARARALLESDHPPRL